MRRVSQRVPTKLLTAGELDRISEAIRRAEATTSGEIRVRIERHDGGDPLARARALMADLDMRRTRGRNGVLIYIAAADRRFAVYGDEAVHRAVGQEIWDGVCRDLGDRFAAGKFGEGIREAVDFVGRKLAEHFPPTADDVDELPDAPSVEE